jgi:hypothetical protein
MVLGRGSKSVWERKGGRERCPSFIQPEREERGSGREQATGGQSGAKEQGVRENGKKRRGFDCGELLP